MPTTGEGSCNGRVVDEGAAVVTEDVAVAVTMAAVIEGGGSKAEEESAFDDWTRSIPPVPPFLMGGVRGGVAVGSPPPNSDIRSSVETAGLAGLVSIETGRGVISFFGVNGAAPPLTIAGDCGTDLRGAATAAVEAAEIIDTEPLSLS